MTEPIELSITVKDAERTLTKKEPLYEGFFMSSEDPILIRKIREVVNEFGGNLEIDAPKIIVKAVLVYQD